MANEILEAAAALREALAGFDADRLDGADCAVLTERLAATEKACAAVRVLAAAQAVAAGAHLSRGYSNGASWMARHAGTTGGRARQDLTTAKQLADCPDTKAALLQGDLSLAQAGEITQAESKNAGAESELLQLAGQSDLTQLRDRARDYRQAHTDPAELRRRQFAARQFRHWRDRDGMIRFGGALPPETGLPLVRRVDLGASRARRAAAAQGSEIEAFEAYAADALAALTNQGGGTQQGPRAELVLVCDLYAWRRGHTHPGEPCHIVGGGPIPVDVARDLSRDAFIKAVLHDGTEIRSVRHFGRNLPAVLRTALDLGPVPQFTGSACVDCGSRWGLQYDHVDPVANHGPTEYANLQARCLKDHQAKTERDRQAGLLGPNAPGPPFPVGVVRGPVGGAGRLGGTSRTSSYRKGKASGRSDRPKRLRRPGGLDDDDDDGP